MQIEYKEITVKKNVYVADDGTVFEDKDACLDYEYNSIAKSLTCYDAEFNKTDDVNECIFVDLATDEEVNKFLYLGECMFTTDGIDGPGLYMYGCGDEWVNIDKAIAKIRGGVDNADEG